MNDRHLFRTVRHPLAAALLCALAGGTAHAAESSIDSLLNWGETAYPQMLIPGAKTTQANGYTYRCYSNGALCLGIKDGESSGQLYLYKQGVGLSSLGAMSDWRKTADKEKIESARVFPAGLAVSAPTRQGGSSFAAAPSPSPSPSPAPMGSASLSYAAATAKISSILSGARALASAFDPNSFLSLANNAACFGPTLTYTNHPDGGSGTLPSGDLGIWLEIDGPTGDACAAAQLNARMDGSSNRANTALMTVASMLRAAISSGTGLPAAGSSVNVLAAMSALGIASTSFTSATIALDGAGSEWTYALAFTFTDGSGVSHDVAIKLVHKPGSSTANYQGVMTQSVTNTFNGGNCGSGSNPVTRIDTLKYERTSTTALNSIQRSGQFCGSGNYTSMGSYDSDGQLKPSSSWADDFSRFGATYNPSTLKGYYLYAWQAGSGDGYSRILQLGINGMGDGTSNDGESYFGYGDAIAGSDGKVKGFHCIWAGPKPATPVGLQTAYAQRQFIRYDSSTGKWSQPTGGSDIRYAPTDSCTYTGSGFWYDRNLNGVNDEIATDLTVSTPDLMGLSGAATIADAISARGYVIPSF